MSNVIMVIVMKRQSKALKILTEEQLNVIKAKFDTGGKDERGSRTRSEVVA